RFTSRQKFTTSARRRGRIWRNERSGLPIAVNAKITLASTGTSHQRALAGVGVLPRHVMDLVHRNVFAGANYARVWNRGLVHFRRSERGRRGGNGMGPQKCA